MLNFGTLSPQAGAFHSYFKQKLKVRPDTSILQDPGSLADPSQPDNNIHGDSEGIFHDYLSDMSEDCWEENYEPDNDSEDESQSPDEMAGSSSVPALPLPKW